MKITNVETKIGGVKDFSGYRSVNDYMSGEIGPNIAQFINDGIEGIANFLGLGSWYKERLVKPTTKYNDLELKVRDVVSKAISEATAQGEVKLSQLQDKLLYLQKGSPTISSFINKARQNIRQQIKKQTLDNAKVSAKAAEAEYHLNKASNASAGDIARGSAHDDLRKARDIVKNLTNTEEKI